MEVQIEKPRIEYENTYQDGDHKHTPATVSINQRCSRCFYSHFPSPNTYLCKWNKKRFLKKCFPVRLRGGAGTDQTKQAISRSVENAKCHGINLHPGVENLANGNCAFESILDSINTRTCFGERFDGTPDYWRKIWMTEVSHVAYEKWNRGLEKDQWMAEWETLKQPRIYEHQLGDMVLPGIAHCTKKDLLIFNTSARAHCPVYVVQSSLLCGEQANTEVPICLGYDQTHYEALVPDTEEDIQRTIKLKQSIVEEKYNLKMEDIPIFKQTNSYAEAVKRKLEDGPQQST